MKHVPKFLPMCAAVSAAFVLSAVRSEAAISILIEEMPGGLQVTAAAGSLDLTGLTLSSPMFGTQNGVFALPGDINGVLNTTNFSIYNGASFTTSAPWNVFGAGATLTSASGPYAAAFCVSGFFQGVWVSSTYVSNTPMPAFSGFAEFANYGSLGLGPGMTYTATWASDSITVTTVPEPAQAGLVLLSGLPLLLRRKRAIA